MPLSFYVENNVPGIGMVESFVQSDDWISVHQAADRMRLSRDTVYRLVNKAVILALRPSQGGIRIPREEVEAWLKFQKSRKKVDV